MKYLDMAIEERIKDATAEIKHYTLACLRRGYPLQYLMNLANYSEKHLNVNYNRCFNYGNNAALDKYLSYPEPRSEQQKFYSLVHGAKEIIRYVDKNKKDSLR